ncbi:hypothetical protein [Lonepinella sp. BR2357]|uniref:hypothetical protein n=1 Tax=Lonepinella sp. BR2357 TaxID=3434549 RepID=UPI003F6DDAC5
MNNLYWFMYKNLEKEVIELSNFIHFSDENKNTYSLKISELIIRICVEFESLSKELYFKNGGSKPDDERVYFDTDCMAYLNSQWDLGKKVVKIVHNNIHFSTDLITPLRKAHKRGTSSEKWLIAYQAIKHNKRDKESFKKANLESLINALAGLFVLNLYYRNERFDLNNDFSGDSFNGSCGSEIFRVGIVKNDKSIYKVEFLNDIDEVFYEEELSDLKESYENNKFEFNMNLCNLKRRYRYKAILNK